MNEPVSMNLRIIALRVNAICALLPSGVQMEMFQTLNDPYYTILWLSNTTCYSGLECICSNQQGVIEGDRSCLRPLPAAVHLSCFNLLGPVARGTKEANGTTDAKHPTLMDRLHWIIQSQKFLKEEDGNRGVSIQVRWHERGLVVIAAFEDSRRQKPRNSVRC